MLDEDNKARINRNVDKMFSQGATEQDVDGYLTSEGLTPAPAPELPVNEYGRTLFPPLTTKTDTERPSHWERFGMNVVEGFKQGTSGVVKDLLGDEQARHAELMRTQAYEAMPEFKGPVEGLISLAGQLTGSIPHAENIIPIPGVGKMAGKIASPFLRKAFTRGGEAAIANVLSDIPVQASRVGMGFQEEFDPLRAGIGGLMGGVIGVAPTVVRKIVSDFRIRKNKADLNIEDLMDARAKSDKDALDIFIENEVTPEQISALEIGTAREVAASGESRRIKRAADVAEAFRKPEALDEILKTEARIDALAPELRQFITEQGKGADIDILRMKPSQQKRLLDLTVAEFNARSAGDTRFVEQPPVSEGLYSPATKPTEQVPIYKPRVYKKPAKTTKEATARATAEIRRKEKFERSHVVTGYGDRPFAKGTEPEETIKFFEARAEKQTAEAKAKMEEDLLRKWKEREQAEYKTGKAPDAEAQSFYKKSKKFSTKNKKPKEDGSFETDKFDFIMSDKGTPIKFATHNQAAKWYMKNRVKTNQIFDLANHPSGDGYTIKVTGLEDVKPKVAPEGQALVRAEEPKVTPEPTVKEKPDIEPTVKPDVEIAPAKAEPPPKPKVITQDDIDSVKGKDFIREDVDIDKIHHSKEISQFKEDADPKTGVVRGQELKGAYEELTAGDIILLRRKNGRLDIVTGRHRLELAKRNNLKTIPAKIVEESDKFNVEWAKAHDAMANIRDEKGTVKDYVKFHTFKKYTESEARKLSLLSRDKQIKGFYIARDSGTGLLSLFNSGGIGENKAYAIVKATPNNESAQNAGILVREKMNADELSNYVQMMASKEFQDSSGITYDLFGKIDMSAQDKIMKIAKLISADKRILKQNIGIVRNALKYPKRVQEMGMGFLKTQLDITKKVKELETRINRLDRFATDRELIAEYRKKLEPELFDTPKVKDNKVRIDDVEVELGGTPKEQQDTADFFSQSRNKFSANPMADPEAYKAMAKEIKKVIPDKEANAWINGIKDLHSSLKDALESSTSLTSPKWVRATRAAWRFVIDSKDTHFAHIENLIDKPEYKKAVNVIRKHFHAPAGKADAVSKTYHEAINMKANSLANELSDIMQDFLGKGYVRVLRRPTENKTMMKQLKNLVTHPKNINVNTKLGKAARDIRKILDDIYVYAKDAGLDISKKENYYPRVTDINAVFNNPTKFKKVMVDAFMKHDGASRKSAVKSADQWIDKIKRQELGLERKTEATKKRIISDKVSDALEEAGFYLDDPMAILGNYFQNIARKAEYSRRFGGDKLDVMLNAVEDAGGSEHIKAIQDLINVNTGQHRIIYTGSARWAVSTLKTMSNFTYLIGTPILQLAEPVLGAVRTGNAADALRMYKFKLKQMAGMAEADIEIAKDIGAIENLNGDMVNARTEDMMSTLSGQRATHRFFNAIGLGGLTRQDRVASITLGRIFINRIADRLLKGKAVKSSKFLFKEFGIPDDKIDVMAKWIQKNHDSIDAIKMKTDKSPEMEMYKTGLLRFADQVIMKPSPAVRQMFAEHPLGSLIHSLTSFVMSFHENVNMRTLRMAKKAVTEKDFDAIDRMRMITPAIMYLALWAPASYAVQELRRKLYKDPKRKEEAKGIYGHIDNIIGASGMMGKFAIPYNWVKSMTQYGKAPLHTLAGPGIGGVVSVAGKTARLATDITSAKRQKTFGKEAYSKIVYPLFLQMLAMSPVPPATKFGNAILGATAFAGKHPVVRDKAVELFTGESTPQGRRRSRRLRPRRVRRR